MGVFFAKKIKINGCQFLKSVSVRDISDVVNYSSNKHQNDEHRKNNSGT